MDELFERYIRPTLAPELLDPPFRGIVSAFSFSSEPAPPSLDLINQTMAAFYGEFPEQPRREFRCAEDVPDQFTAGFAMYPGAPGHDAVYGIPMVIDRSLPAGDWELVEDGIVVLRGSTGRFGPVAPLPPNPFWMLEPGRYGLTAPRQPEPQGDILARIDAAIDDWEYGPDAFRSKPEDVLTD